MIHRLRLSNSYYSGKSASRVVDACGHRPTRRSRLSINPTQRFLIRAAAWGSRVLAQQREPTLAGQGSVSEGPPQVPDFSTSRRPVRDEADRQSSM